MCDMHDSVLLCFNSYYVTITMCAIQWLCYSIAYTMQSPKDQMRSMQIGLQVPTPHQRCFHCLFSKFPDMQLYQSMYNSAS